MKQELDGWSEKQPNKPIMFTEYGADTLAGLHSVNDELFTEEYQVRYYEANHEVIDQYPQFIGEQTWNFADFETSSGIIRVQGNKKGIFTRERRPKAVAHYLRKDGVIYLTLVIKDRDSLSEKHCEIDNIPVKQYTYQFQLELSKSDNYVKTITKYFKSL